MSSRAATDGTRRASAHFLWLRIVLALSVVLAHFAAISGSTRPPWLPAISSTIAVQAFFVVSGWIVPASFDRSATTLGFWLRRFARLYPLYAVVVCVQGLLGLGFGAAVANPAGHLLRYLAVNLVFANFVQPSPFGLFADARVQAINPSLWTLKIEVLFYLLAPLLVVFYRARQARALIWLCIGSTALFYLARYHSENLARQLPGQLRFFVAGMLCWQLSAAGVGRASRLLLPVALLGLVLAHRFEHSLWLAFAQPAFVAAFVYGIALSVPEPRRMPDVSYGLYILHAPLIQFGLWLGWWPADLRGLACAIAATALLASAAWYGLERPAIQLGRRWSDSAARRKQAALPAACANEPAL